MGLFDSFTKRMKSSDEDLKKAKLSGLFSRPAQRDPVMEQEMQAEAPATTYPAVKKNGVESIIEQNQAIGGPDDMGEFDDTESLGQVDTEAPKRHELFDKKNILGTILGIAAPAAASLAGGEGLLYGAATGAGALADNADDDYKTDVNLYNKAKDQALNTGYKKAMIDLSVGKAKADDNKFDETVRHNKAVEDKPLRKSDYEAYRDLLGQAGEFAKRGEPLPGDIKRAIEVYEQKNFITQ